MRQNLFVLLLLFLHLSATAQHPNNVIQLSSKTIVIPCGSTCTSITATVPHIKQSTDYIVQNIAYDPFAFEGGTELTSLYTDDIFSSSLALPFPVCFYGAPYNSLVVGSNGLVSFDVSNAGRRNNFRLTTSFSNLTPVRIPYAGGTQNSLASTYYPKAAIMGVYHDIFLVNNGLRRIEWRVEGTAPKRRFIASFKDVPMYGCTSLTATHQIVVYESTGVVEVYVRDKPVCTAWNQGLAILGIQNFERNKAHFPSGKNTGTWGDMALNEGYRFLPAGGTSAFKRAELLAEGTVVALADTASGTNGELALRFANICPAADSTQYLLRVTYASCSTSAEVSFTDTLTIKKETLAIDVQTENPTCTTTGTISVIAKGTAASLLYSLNGGPQQASPVFSNLPAGDYTVTATATSGCVVSVAANLTLQDDLLLVAQPAATICAGETLAPRILSNGTLFQWTPSAGVNNPAIAHPQLAPTSSTTYTLTATKGSCEKKAALAVTVKPRPVASAGNDQTIIQGDATIIPATASDGSFEWSPTTGLTSATAKQPSAAPLNSTTYRLTVTRDGCSASDEVTITVVPYCIKPMEAFTPNGDGVNDHWLVTTGACLQKAKVEVFNRYGAKVYHSEDYKNNWNATFEGKPLADGTYYFLITYQLINGKTVQAKGNVTILR